MIEGLSDLDDWFYEEYESKRYWNHRFVERLSTDAITISITWEFSIAVQRSRM